MIKLIALDVDGTLLNSRREITEQTKKVIKQAIHKGIYVVICTGRPILGVQNILDTLELSTQKGYVITFNGGLIQKTDTQEEVASVTHSKEDILYIYHTLFEHGLPMNMIDMNTVYAPTYPKGTRSLYPDVMSKHLVLENREIDSFVASKRFNKVVCCVEQEKLDSIFPTLPLKMRTQYNCFKSRNILMEIVPQNVSKSNGLNTLCQLLNIMPDEVMAMGDEENDIDMIAFAGYGIAMGNASDNVKKIAKYITDTNDNDGVAKAIEKYAL